MTSKLESFVSIVGLLFAFVLEVIEEPIEFNCVQELTS